jgi:2-keto-4-pentenoate hydratase/2-oxohepta-3-ene-1,7-dioic acid hydratase in catechol pathway
MRLAAFIQRGQPSIGVIDTDRDEIIELTSAGLPATLDEVIALGAEGLARLESAAQASVSRLPLADVHWLPPIKSPSKCIAVGLNYVDHATEANFAPPAYPVLFSRFPSSWVAHGQPLHKPTASDEFDYEGEMVIVIGKPGRNIPKDCALEHVYGYSIFNEGSIRDYQMKTQQWMMGKNFDKSGSFGPYIATADELPEGAKGLQISTRLNGKVVQQASTSDMIFDVPTIISIASVAFELQPGDIIVSGTPAGVGFARNPPLFMKPGDVCEVEIEKIGLLRNKIIQGEVSANTSAK